MSIRTFRTLQAIARHGSFASAGAAVGLTQSAVSLQVKSLEEEFGAKLFDRSRRIPVLTDAGKVLVEKSAEVLALYDQLGPALSEEGVLAGKVKLGVIQTALATFLPDALLQLNAAHPDARFHVVAGMSAELAAQVAAHELDAAITTELVRPHPPDLISTPLYEDQFWVVAPKGQEHLSPSELLQAYPFIRFDRASWAGRMIDRALRQMQIRPQEEMILDNQRVILSMVERGLGTAIVPMSPQLAQEIPLTCLPFGTPHMTRRIVMLERPGHSGGQLAAAMAEVMIDLAGSRTC